ncbi:hypothetical protein ACIRRA_39810 [Nocardia sp. NPDC101769]
MDVEKRLTADARVIDTQMAKMDLGRLFNRIMATADALDNSSDPTSK